MSDFVSADEAQKLLDGAGFNEKAGEGIDSLDTNGAYALYGGYKVSDIIYYDGSSEDVTGQGHYMPTGGMICKEVPADIAPLFIKSPDLARTVIAQAEHIERLQAAIAEILPEYNRLDVDEQRMEEPHQEPQETTYADLGLKKEDMECR